MLIRLISVISLLTFMLLLISGADIDVSLYRGILVFLVLFTVVYLAMFFMNIARDNPEEKSLAVEQNQNAQNKNEL